MIIRVVLEGGVPWGFRVDSDSRDHPPRISKVRARGKADRAGLRPNDVILSVNGRSTAGLRDVDLIDLIQQSQQVLRLELERAVHQSAAQADGWETVNDTPSCVSDARSESKVHPAGVQLSQHLISVKDCNTHATSDWPGHNVSRSSSLPHKDEQDLSLTEQSEQEKATRLSSPQNPTITHLVQKKDDVVHSDDDDVSEMTSGLDSESSASATSHLQELNTYNGVHEQPPDRRQSSSLSNSNTASRPTLHQAEPDEFRGSINASSSITSEGQNASLLATKSVTETQTAASGVQKQNSVNDADSLLPNDEVFVTEKRPVRMNRFKGIGPRDEATGIPIASKSLVEESCQKEWYRQMYLAMHKLTGLKCSPMFVFAGNDPDPRLSVACRLSSSSSTDNSPINAALRRSVGRQESTESTACRQSCSRSRRSSSCSSSPRISPHPSFTHCQNRFGQPSDVMSKTASPPMIPSSRDTTCDNFTAPGDRQVLVTASATPNGNHGDPPSQHSAQMLNGGGGFGNKYESVGDGNLVNGRSNHDTKIPNDVSHMHVSGSKANSQRDSVQRLCALYNYNPRHADELQLNKGDVIYLVDVCDDGWFLGTSARTGQFGTFPGNYVRPVT